MANQPPEWINWLLNRPAFFALYFIALWSSVCYLLGAMSGWIKLSPRFRRRGAFYGEKWPFRSARMRFFVQYKSCLDIGADESGLYLSIFPIFRIGHPPLLIPWSEILVVSGVKGIIFRKRELCLGRQELVPLRISSSLAETLQRSAGEAWPIESVAV
jgi:hypothetical protein